MEILESGAQTILVHKDEQVAQDYSIIFNTLAKDFVPDRVGILGQNPALAHRSRNIQRPKERLQSSKMSDIPHFVQKTPSFKQRKD